MFNRRNKMKYKIGKLTITLKKGKSSLDGTIQEDQDNANMRDYNSNMEGVEEFLLALVEAGIDVETEAFKVALKKVQDVCGGRSIL